MGAHPSAGMRLEAAVGLRVASGGNSESSFSTQSLLLHQLAPRQTEKCKPIDAATGYLETPSVMQLENVLAVRRDASYREGMCGGY